jgi:hypothetical protein
MMTQDEVRATSPEVRKTTTGWIAVSDRNSLLKVGVSGPSKEATEEAFRLMIARWASYSKPTTTRL